MRYLSIILLILSLPASALGATFTLWDQFPISQGANNFYAYGYSYDAVSPSYREIIKTGDYSYYTNQTWGIPTLARSTDPWIFMHPSYQYGTLYGHEDALLAWKPGNTVAYELDIIGSFESINYGNTHVYIRKNAEVLWEGGVSNYSNAAFNLPDVILNPGEILYFGVNSNGYDTNDGTLLSGTITYPNPVPVPGTLILMLSGLGGLWGWRRFK